MNESTADLSSPPSAWVFFSDLMMKGADLNTILTDYLPEIRTRYTALSGGFSWDNKVFERAFRDFLDDVCTGREERAFSYYLPPITEEMIQKDPSPEIHETNGHESKSSASVPASSTPTPVASFSAQELERINAWTADASNPNLAPIQRSTSVGEPPAETKNSGEFANPSDVEIDESEDVQQSEEIEANEKPAKEFFGDAYEPALNGTAPKIHRAISQVPPNTAPVVATSSPKTIPAPTAAVTTKIVPTTVSPVPPVVPTAQTPTLNRPTGFAELKKFADARNWVGCVETLVANQWLCERYAAEIFRMVYKKYADKPEDRRRLLERLLIIDGWDLPPRYDAFAEELAATGNLLELAGVIIHGGVSDGFAEGFARDYAAGKALRRATVGSKMFERALHELAPLVRRDMHYQLSVKAKFGPSLEQVLAPFKKKWQALRALPKKILSGLRRRLVNLLEERPEK